MWHSDAVDDASAKAQAISQIQMFTVGEEVESLLLSVGYFKDYFVIWRCSCKIRILLEQSDILEMLYSWHVV